MNHKTHKQNKKGIINPKCTVYRGNLASITFGENEKTGYEIISEKFKFGDWALAKAMTSSLLYYIMREI